MTKSECYRVAILAVVNQSGMDEETLVDTLRELFSALETAEWEEANRSGE